MRKLYLSVFAMLSLFLFGCSINNNSNDEVLVDEIEDSVLNNASGSFDIVSFSREILSLMDSGFFDEISNFVHPIK
jgi:PBP1b-binding outer membrane lipoprotein LpoB